MKHIKLLEKTEDRTPTKEEIRSWFHKVIYADNLPTPDEVRADLNWTSAEPVRKMVLS